MPEASQCFLWRKMLERQNRWFLRGSDGQPLRDEDSRFIASPANPLPMLNPFDKLWERRHMEALGVPCPKLIAVLTSPSELFDLEPRLPPSWVLKPVGAACKPARRTPRLPRVSGLRSAPLPPSPSVVSHHHPSTPPILHLPTLHLATSLDPPPFRSPHPLLPAPVCSPQTATASSSCATTSTSPPPNEVRPTARAPHPSPSTSPPLSPNSTTSARRAAARQR